MGRSTETLLIELGTEELPPTALKNLATAFAQGVAKGLNKVELNFTACEWLASPRRLAVRVKNLETLQKDQSIQRRGPAVKAAFTADGEPTQAAIGFAKSNGVTVNQLQTIETDKGAWLSHTQEKKGLTANELIPGLIANALDTLPIPKRMTWGSRTTAFVRPTHWLLVMLGSETVACELLEQTASNVSYGHRFHANQAIPISHATEYEAALEKAFVIVDYHKRQAIIREQILASADQYNANVEMDQALLDEVTGLVEWPVTLCGEFDPEFLEVPAESLVSAMKGHQKYFPLHKKLATGSENIELVNRFITIANIESSDPAKIIAGNEKVIRPRLADARYFYQMDKKQGLDSFNDRLRKVVFQKGLGSVYDKSQRVAQLAHYIAQITSNNCSKTMQRAKRAGELAKADLATDMVGEFPDLQGTMGYYYALAQGENIEIALAIKEQYMPKSSGGELPSTAAGTSLALAEKLDTLVGIFGIGQKPSGDKDPFALRRAALGVINILIGKEIELSLKDLVLKSVSLYGDLLKNKTVGEDISQFFLDRYRAFFQADNNSETIETEVIVAVESLRPDSPLDFSKRIHAVQYFKTLDGAEALAIANKRVANILKKSQLKQSYMAIDSSLLVQEQETNLVQAISALEESVSQGMAESDYTAVLVSLAKLRQPIDDFFDHVMVNVDDEKLKMNRLCILKSIHELFTQVANIALLTRS